MVSIEESIFKSLLYQEEYARKVLPHLEEEYFDGVFRTLFKVYKELFDKYNNIPSLDAIGVMLQKTKLGEAEFEEIYEIVETIHDSKDDLPDVDWLVDETEAYCKDKKIYNVIYQSLNILEGDDKKFDKHAIPTMMDEALAVSFNTTLGMDFFEDAAKRYDIYTADDARIKFPLDALNILSNGGGKPKSLSAILAGTNVGKSAMMCYLAGEFVKAGLNVVYFSMEMGEEIVSQRVEANLLGVKTDDLEKLSREEYISKIDKVKSKTHGKLIVKEYPTSAAHAGHFRHFLKELKQKKKIVPDYIFIDYINICASSRYKSLTGVNSYSYIKAIAEELRGLAVEFEVPIMTATQVNRDGMNDNSPDMTSTSESFGLPATLDWYIAITQDEVLKDNDQQLVHLLKTRWGNKSKVKPQLVGINWDLMRYSDVGTVNEVADKVGKNKPEFKSKQDKLKEKTENKSSIEW